MVAAVGAAVDVGVRVNLSINGVVVLRSRELPLTLARLSGVVITRVLYSSSYVGALSVNGFVLPANRRSCADLP